MIVGNDKKLQVLTGEESVKASGLVDVQVKGETGKFGKWKVKSNKIELPTNTSRIKLESGYYF